MEEVLIRVQNSHIQKRESIITPMTQVNKSRNLLDPNINRTFLKNSLTRNKSISMGEKMKIMKSFDHLNKTNKDELNQALNRVQTQLGMNNNTILKKRTKQYNKKVIKLKKLSPKNEDEQSDMSSNPVDAAKKVSKIKRCVVKTRPSELLPNLKELMLPTMPKVKKTTHNTSLLNNLSKQSIDDSETSETDKNSSFSSTCKAADTKVIRIGRKSKFCCKHIAPNPQNTLDMSLDSDSDSSPDSIVSKPRWMSLGRNSKSKFCTNKISWIKNTDLYQQAARKKSLRAGTESLGELPQIGIKEAPKDLRLRKKSIGGINKSYSALPMIPRSPELKRKLLRKSVMNLDAKPPASVHLY